ncbi:hypothetical protein [Kitasatospora sp. DSM 101779]|uniref:hypothetical protein n=1 Tax=Kitasatospora sp. DSM 101779 TaxID=2853165 RepID=UPI0021DB629F|nr:hypothetical protein [Kitasatospora sp. DSM 101779]MCU7826740.1 hypothetical protein [Kitasatospora sp. DSM 101779]
MFTGPFEVSVEEVPDHPELVLDQLVEAARTAGGIDVVGRCVPEDPEAATEDAKEGRIGFGYGTFFTKGRRTGTGQCPVKRYNARLRDLIVAGRAEPSFLVSHELPLTEAPRGYRCFNHRDDGRTKILLRPAALAA